MALHLDEALQAIHRPDAITPDPIGGRWRYWRNATGPTRWMFVVVDWDEPTPQVVTAYGKRRIGLR